MSKQRNRHRRNRQRPDNPVQNGISTGNDGDNDSHRVKSVVTTNVTKKNQNNDKQWQGGDGQNRRNDNNQNRQSENSGKRSHKRRNRRKKNKSSKLRNVRQEDLFQLKDPKRAKRLQNKKKRPRNFAPYSIVKAESTICPICEKKIENMADTIADKRTGQQAHFACVYEMLLKTLSLRDSQRLSYMGSGVFAVIEDISDEGKMRFKIKERFEYVK